MATSAGRRRPGHRDRPDRADRVSRAAAGAVLALSRRCGAGRGADDHPVFLYNSIFFTYGLVLEFFFHVNPKDTGWYFLAFAVGNLAGPLTIGRLFDTIGRRKMFSGAYLIGGNLLVITGQLFKAGGCSALAR